MVIFTFYTFKKITKNFSEFEIPGLHSSYHLRQMGAEECGKYLYQEKFSAF